MNEKQGMYGPPQQQPPPPPPQEPPQQEQKKSRFGGLGNTVSGISNYFHDILSVFFLPI